MNKRTMEKQKEYSARKSANLTDAYVANCLRLPVSLARTHPDLLELKRSTLLLYRTIKAFRKGELSYG